MSDWLKEKGRLLGTIGAALAAVLVDFSSKILSVAFDAAFMIGLLILVLPALWKKKE